MSDVIVFNLGANPQNVLQYLQNQDDPLYNKRNDVILRPDLSGVAAQPVQYWKVTAWTDSYHGTIEVMTAQEQAAVDTASANAFAAAVRADAKNFIIGFLAEPLVLRAIADTIKDEVNLLREWIVSFKVAVAGAATLAALKTAVAALPDMPDRTLTQFKTTINNKVDGGTIDS